MRSGFAALPVAILIALIALATSAAATGRPKARTAMASHAGWPSITGMLLMNKRDQRRPLDGRPGHDPFDGSDPTYSCDGLHNNHSCVRQGRGLVSANRAAGCTSTGQQQSATGSGQDPSAASGQDQAASDSSAPAASASSLPRRDRSPSPGDTSSGLDSGAGLPASPALPDPQLPSVQAPAPPSSPAPGAPLPTRCATPSKRGLALVVPLNIGHNELLGGHGDNVIHAGPAGDVIWGDYKPSGWNPRQRNELFGGPGADYIYAGHGFNDMRTGAGADHVFLVYGHGIVECDGPGHKILVMRKLARNRHWRLRGCANKSIVTYAA